jgi:hypothetical protein
MNLGGPRRGSRRRGAWRITAALVVVSGLLGVACGSEQRVERAEVVYYYVPG